MSQSQQNYVQITPNGQGFQQAYDSRQEQSNQKGQYSFQQYESKQSYQNNTSNMDSYYNSQQPSSEAAYNQRIMQSNIYETPTPNGDNFTADSMNQTQNHTSNRVFQGENQMSSMYPITQNYPLYQQQLPSNQYPQEGFVQTGLLKLQNILGVYIKQKFETLESITGCETPNIYKVYEADANGNKISSKILFKCKEKSNCCVRNCLPGSARPFTMVVKNKSDKDRESGNNRDDSNFLFLQKDFKCTFLCLARPKLDVTLIEQGSNKLIGSIFQPFTFCEVILDILDSYGNIRFHIIGESLCMPAIYCKNIPCRSCQEGVFLVTNPDRSILSYITKHTAGCIKQCISDVSYFGVSFPLNSTPEEKALIMAAVIFLDYRYFEESPQDKNNITNQEQIYVNSNQIELQDLTHQRLSP